MLRRLVFLVGFLLPQVCCGQTAVQQETPPAGQLELFCGTTLGYADTNWLRLYDVQINVLPGLRWHLGHDWTIAAQTLLPIISEGYTFRDKT